MPRYTEQQARDAVAASFNYSEVLRRLGLRPAGGNHRLIRHWVDDVWRIPTEHFDPDRSRHQKLGADPVPLELVLVEHSTYSRRTLKQRLFSSGLKQRRCELCGQDEVWRGRRMGLILDHVNGVPDDNRIENLRIVCPNCNATLDTHCGRRNRLDVEPRECRHCGESFVPRFPKQRYCCRDCGQRGPAGGRRVSGSFGAMSERVVDDGMRDYYDQRAPEYDDWWNGTGLFADRDRPGWGDEVQRLIEVVRSLAPGRVLDVACGTGFLTRHLRGQVTAIDQSPEMVAIASRRIPTASISVADAVPLAFGDGEFDRVFTSHFYGHLLPAERERFLAEARRVGRQLVVVDSALRPDGEAEQRQQRVLNDGSRHEVYKRFFTGEQLASELGGGEVLHDGGWFVVVAAEADPA